MKHVFIVNPYAGSMTFANNLRQQLEQIEGFEYFLFHSRYTGNETELTKKIVADNSITCLMITHNVQSALQLGNRTIMMKDGQIVMELSGTRRSTITTDELLKAFHDHGVDNDRILFSAE